MKDTEDFLYDSQYIEAYASVLDNETSRFLYVENELDCSFWKSFLGNDLAKQFHITAEFKGGEAVRGKCRFHGRFSSASNSCCFGVDADFDWLAPGNKVHALEMSNNPYVFHTFLYSKESYFNISEYVESCLGSCTYGDDADFHLSLFLEAYSSLVSPFLLKYLYLINEGESYDQSIFLSYLMADDFCKLYETMDFSDMTSKIKAVDDFFGDVEVPEAFCREIEEKGYKRELSYLFLPGHFLEDKIVQPIVDNIINKWHRESIEKIKKNYKGSPSRSSKINEVRNHFSRVNKCRHRQYGDGWRSGECNAQALNQFEILRV